MLASDVPVGDRSLSARAYGRRTAWTTVVMEKASPSKACVEASHKDHDLALCLSSVRHLPRLSRDCFDEVAGSGQRLGAQREQAAHMRKSPITRTGGRDVRQHVFDGRVAVARAPAGQSGARDGACPEPMWTMRLKRN